MAGYSGQRSYSVVEAIGCAESKIAYCDRMAAYRDAQLENLRAHATAFLQILESQPRNLELLRGLRQDLVSGRQHEGTGWDLLTSYVDEYVQRLEREHA